MSVLDPILRAGEGRRYKRAVELARRVNDFEAEGETHDEAELRGKTEEFRRRLADGESLDDLLPEAFACVREAAKRTIGQRHFDVQVVGAAVLHDGNIAEMKTGEGKTLVATMPAYLNALSGQGVHVVTVNDYLSKRDSEWMGAIYRFLGLSVGLIQGEMTPSQRRPAYAADITYGTNNEFGFDYLRDNMAMRQQDMVQRGHYFAIVDEVDSILIDEARTPLIINGPAVINIYNKYDELKPGVERLVHAQEQLCNRFLSEAEELLKKIEEGKGGANKASAETEHEI